MKFSILVPVYNVEQYLEQCVESLVNQTYQGAYEIILVDDGSTDSSGKMCDEFQEKYPQKIKAVHKDNQGLVSARDAGIMSANGDFCVFCDSDDFVESDLLQKVYTCIQNNDNTDIVIYSFRYFNNKFFLERKITLSDSETMYENDDKKILYEALISNSLATSLWAKAVKTDILKSDPTDYSNYYDKNMAEDWFRSIHLLTAAKKIVYINEPLYNYRTNDESISRSFRVETIPKKNMLYVYDRFLEYLPKWGMNDDEHIDKLKSRWFGEAMYTFSSYYENAHNRKEKRAIVDYDWDSMMPDGAPNTTTDKTRRLYDLVKNKKYTTIDLIFLKKKIYKKYKSVKLRLKQK